MTEEEIKALQTAKEEAERKAAEALAAVEAAKAEALKAKEDVNKVVDELKELRSKRTPPVDNANINNKELDVNSLIEQALAQKEEERRKTEFEEAVAEFKSSKTEFQNDSAGLVFGKFKESLKKFNFSDVTTKSQAKTRLEEAYRFLNGTGSTIDSENYEGGLRVDGLPPVKQDGLSKDTTAAMQVAKIDKDKFANLKSKYPEALASLGIIE